MKKIKPWVRAYYDALIFCVIVVLLFSIPYTGGMGDSGGNLKSVLSGRLVIDDARNRILVLDTDGTPKLLAGVDEDGGVRVKLAQTGIDVKVATDNELIFSSDFNLFKVVQSDTDSLTIPNPLVAGSTQTLTIAHNLGYIPAAMVYANVPTIASLTNSGQLAPLPLELLDVDSIGSEIYIHLGFRIDDTNLYIDVKNTTGVDISSLPTPWTFRYYIFIETAATS